jgi:hypothetical protein
MMLLPGRSRLTWREHCAGQTPEKQLNEQQIVGPADRGPDYDIMPDGQHFVFLMGQAASAATHYNVVLNWFEELKQRVLVK